MHRWSSQRTLPCLCDVGAVPCPFHIALDQLQWLRASRHSDEGTALLFPTSNGTVASKASVVRTSELLGECCEQPIFTEHGLRRLSGHTPRVSGSLFYAALGLEVNKIRLLARHSGDTILRYVKDAPLKSIRADLGIALQGKSPTASSSRSSSSTVATARIISLEAKVAELERALQAHMQKLTSLNAAAQQNSIKAFVQNTTTATGLDLGLTVFGVDSRLGQA